MFQLNKILVVTLFISCCALSATAICERATPTSWLFPGPTCEQFISCSNGREYIMDCPAGLHFSVAADRCEWPHLAGCTGGSETTTVAPPPPPGTDVCAAATPTQWLFPGPTCEQFISCSNGVPHIMDCPAGLHFSVAANRCEWPHIAGCASSTPPTPSPTPTPTPTPPPPPGTDVCSAATPTQWLFPGPTCEQFISCSNGVPHIMDCPAGLHFSVAANRCEWPHIAGCASSTPPTPSPTPTPPPRPDTDVCAAATPTQWLFPGPTCEQFISCSNGVPHIMDCPAGLHFSVAANRCEWPHIAGCDSSTPPTPSPTPTPPPPPGTDVCAAATPTQWLFPGPTCEQFISCSNGVPHIMDCPAGLHFSVAANRCEWPHIAGCASSTPPTPSPTPTPPPPPGTDVCAAATPTQWLFPGPTCEQFISCSNGVPHIMDCPAGLHFSVAANRCEWPHIAGCDSSAPPTPSPTPTPPPPPPGTDVCAAATPTQWLFPGPTCEQFISCSNGVPHIMDCPAGLHFSVAANRCEWPHIAGCASSTPPTPSPTPTPPPPPGSDVCAAATPTQWLFPGPTCEQFISCSNGVPHIMDCPAGLHFSVAANRCEWPHIAGCASSTPPTPSPTPTPTPPPPPGTDVCAAATPTQWLFPGPTCEQFISCSNGVPHIMDCPAGLHFSVAANRCEWPHIAGCDSSAPPTPSPTPTPPPPPPGTDVCAAATPTQWLFPGPTCEQFISCSNGVPHIMDCPAGLHFSVAANRCEWPHIAGCDSSAPPTPSPTPTPPPPPGTDVCAAATPTQWLFPGPTCEQFISCSNGVPHIMDCPAGLHFSVAANRCEWPHIAGCDSSAPPTPSPTPTPPPPPPGTDVCAAATPTQWLFPGPTCEQFISCSNGVPHIMDCPAGLHFSVAANRCEWPHIAGCDSSAPPTPSPTPTPPPPPGTDVCAAATPTQWLFPGPTCEQFISCSNGVPHIMDCPAGLHFSVAANRCEWPHIAGCDSSTPSTPSPTPTPPPPPGTDVCAAATPTQWLFPGPTCEQFISCSNGVPHIMNCPAGLHFSVAANRCEWPHIAGCAPPTPQPTTTSAPPSGTEVCANATPTQWLFPGPVCTQFYSCSNGRAYLMNCPAGLHFSVAANRCEWQDIAGCI